MNDSQTIVSLEEASRRVRDATEADAPLVSQVLRGGTSEIETILRRQIVSRGTITEYHTIRRGTCELWLNQFPVMAITSIHEDPDRDYGASALLTALTNYTVDVETGMITRVDQDTPIAWDAGFEAVKVVYTAGYSQASVPEDLKALALELFALQWADAHGERYGVGSVSTPLGNVNYSGPAELTPHMLARLDRHRKFLFQDSTYSRSTVAP